LAPAAEVLATATPAVWDRTCQEIADRLGTDTDTTRRALHRAVRACHDDPRAAATRQLDNTRQVRARLEAAVAQTPEQRWAATAIRIDPACPGSRTGPPWPPPCNTSTTKGTTSPPSPEPAPPRNPWRATGPPGPALPPRRDRTIATEPDPGGGCHHTVPARGRATDFRRHGAPPSRPTTLTF
jgi:hypothetical protein